MKKRQIKRCTYSLYFEGIYSKRQRERVIEIWATSNPTKEHCKFCCLRMLWMILYRFQISQFSHSRFMLQSVLSWLGWNTNEIGSHNHNNYWAKWKRKWECLSLFLYKTNATNDSNWKWILIITNNPLTD